MKTILISETFETIQGEGMFAGLPSLFIRTSGCNLRCWWCDTPYTSWKPEGVAKSVDELAALVQGYKHRHVVITGGEPMLYGEEVGRLVHRAQSAGKVVTVETNGTIYRSDVQPDLFSVSPKLASSAPSGGPEKAMHEKNLAADYAGFDSHKYKTQFKFVASAPADVVEVESLAAEHRLKPESVWMMPEGRTRDEVLQRGAWLAEVCKERGWNLCLRQHVLLWGNRRGV